MLRNRAAAGTDEEVLDKRIVCAAALFIWLLPSDNAQLLRCRDLHSPYD
jgi:hypothetical protein